jgi:hypothetical protein
LKTIPVAVGSAVEGRHTSTSPKYIRARRSNWRPAAFAENSIETCVKWHDGGVYVPRLC